MNSLILLHKKANQSYYSDGYLYFELSIFVLKIGVEENIMPFLDSDYFQNIDNELIGMIVNNDIKATSFELQDYENIDDREYSEDYSSISKIMYYIIKLIIKSFPNSIYNYKLYIDYGDEFCGLERYFYNIMFKNDYILNNELTGFLIELDIRDDTENPDFYSHFFISKKEITDNKSLNILSTNTKVRRLGYFKLLSSFIENKKIPVISIYKKFELFCTSFSQDLVVNENTKGLIKITNSGISSKPYIETAANFEFLNKINNIYSSGKSFKVYQILNQQFPNELNIFKLSNFDKIFFLENILKCDYFYFNNLLEIIYVNEKISYSQIINSFKDKLVNQLKEFNQLNDFDRNRKVANEINLVLKRILSWEKPEVYLEHIIMPRLNWMLDLELINLDKKNNVEITKIGNNLFENLLIWNDINKEKVIAPNSFLDLFMVHIFDICYNDERVINPNDNAYILQKIYHHIDDSFEFFKTLAPNRVTASQAINYTKYKLYFEDNIKVGFQYIKNKLADKEQNRFVFKYQEQYQDGYIQRKNK